MIRVYIVATRPMRDRLEESIATAGGSIVGWTEDLEDVDVELAAEAEIVLIECTGEIEEELLDLILL